jgi:hypothetical protein
VKYFKPSEDKTITQHDVINQQVRSFLQLPPSHLLPHHRHLLTRNINKLGSSSTTAKQFWIADVQAALNEAALVSTLKRKTINLHNSYVCSKHSVVANINAPLFPTKKANHNNTSNKRRKLS